MAALLEDVNAPVDAGAHDATAWEAVVRRHLTDTWGAQSCRRASDWPDVFARLMAAGAATPGGSGYGRGSLKDAVNEAVTELAQTFADQASLDAALARMRERFKGQATPVMPGFVVWVCFPKLDQAHAAELAALLMGDM